MAVELTGLIVCQYFQDPEFLEWVDPVFPGFRVIKMDCVPVFPGSRATKMGCFQYFQDSELLKWVVFSISRIQSYQNGLFFNNIEYFQLNSTEKLANMN